MANLLEEASLLLTPTAYNNGSMLAVKPSEDLLGPELVANGDFSTDSVWAKDANWSIANGKATSTGGGRMFQSIPFLETNIGSKVVVSFDIVDYTSGGVVIQCYGSSSETFTGVGTHTFETVTTNTLNFYINNSGQGNLVGSIDNVSVKVDLSGDFIFTRNSAATRVNAQGLVENVQILSSNLVSNGDFSQEGSELITNGDFATDSNWNKSGGWTISGGKANADGSSGNLTQTNVNYVGGNTYKLTFTVSDYVSGSALIRNGNVAFSSTQINANGNYEIFTVASGSYNSILFFNSGSLNASIDNVSVKEVGQDWTLGSGWNVGDDKVNTIGENQYLIQTNVSGSGVSATLKVQWTQEITSGSRLRFFPRNFNDTGGVVVVSSSVEGTGSYTNGNALGDGVFTLYIETTNGYSFKMLSETGNNGSVTNISVVEITNDTNLPRINYEGFNYQDSLGSELVSGSNSGNISSSSVYTDIYTNASVVNGKTYAVTFTAQDLESTIQSWSWVNYLPLDNSILYNNGTNTAYVIATGSGNLNLRFFSSSGRTGTLSNISIKEYLGQEVVPDSGCGSWLLEPQSTNTYNYSEPISNDGPSSNIAYESFDWGIGFSNCIKFGSNDQFRYRYGGSVQDATEYTISAFVIMDDLSEPILDTGGSSGDFKFVLGGLIGGVANENVYYGNNVYRVSATMTSGSSSGNSGPIKYPSQSSKGFRITGIQIEQGLFPTSYIPTNGAASTRLRDLSGNSGNTGLINSTEGVLYVDFAAYSTQNTREITLSDGTGNNRIIISYNANNRLDVNLYTSGGYQAIFNYTGISDSTAFNKIAFKYKENDCSLWVNGVEVGVDTNAPIMPIGLDILNLASSNGATNIMYGKVNAVAVFKTALTDEQLTALTTI